MAKTHTHTQSGLHAASERTMTTKTTKTKDDEEEAMDTAATCEEAAGKKSVNIVFTMFLLHLCYRFSTRFWPVD